MTRSKRLQRCVGVIDERIIYLRGETLPHPDYRSESRLGSLFQELWDEDDFDDYQAEHEPPHRSVEKGERDGGEDCGTTQPHPVADDRIFEWRAHATHAGESD